MVEKTSGPLTKLSREAKMRKAVLFLYGNRPEPLPIHMLHLLGGTDKYRASILYYDRVNSPVSIPLSGLLDPKQCSVVTWPVGKHLFSKIINRCIVLARFIKTIRALNPDVIHAWNLEMLLVARIAAGRSKHAKVVFSLQDTTEWMLSPLAKAVQRWAYRGADLIFVTSQGFEFLFLRRFHLIRDEQKVVFVPNVPPAAQFTRFKPRTPGTVLTVGYIGLFRGVEGIRTLVEAVRLARDEGANIRALFAGTGIERDLVVRLAKENSFLDYHGPYRHDQDILDIYGKVDLLYAIYGQSYDKKIHLAYRLCEAVNCRLPIIVAKGTHMSKVVGTHNIGISIELGNVEGLARELTEFYRSPEKRICIALNCEKARPQFVFEYYQERILEAYGSLWTGTAQHVTSAPNDVLPANSIVRE